MKGLLFYHREDVERNRAFITLLTQAAQRRGVMLSLVVAEQLEAQGAGEEWHFPYRETQDVETVLLEKPSFAIMRTRDAALSERVERAGVRAFNSSAVCAMANDKRRTYEAFLGEVPMMHTWRLPEDTDHPEKPWPPKPEDYPLVVKPADGHGGAGVALAKDEAQLEALLAPFGSNGVVVQPLSSQPGRDLRVYVLGGEILCGVMREAENQAAEFRSNFSLGGNARLHTLSAEERALVERVLQGYHFDLAGIDLIYHQGAPVLNEIEDVVGCRMLYTLTDVDIADRYLAYILSVL